MRPTVSMLLIDVVLCVPCCNALNNAAVMCCRGEQTFSLARRALKPGGLLLFSTEDLDSSPMRRSVQGSCSIPGSGEKERGGGEGVELLSSARYAHSQSYIMGLADTYRFHVCRVQALVIRTEASVPLPGRIFLLQNST